MGLPTLHPDNIKLIMIAKAKVVIFVIGSLLFANPQTERQQGEQGAGKRHV
jgi:hypothetical protein